MPAVTWLTWALAVASLAGMGGMRSVLVVMSVDVEAADLGPCSIEPRDSFLDLRAFL